MVDTTNLEGFDLDLVARRRQVPRREDGDDPPRSAPKDQLPPLLQGFGAVPPLVTDIDLSMDDKFLYVACWGTGEMRQYDVTEPRKPRLETVHRRRCTSRTLPERQRPCRRSADGRDPAVTANRSTGPTRSTRRGTTNSI